MANLHMLCEVKYENALALNAKGHLVSQDMATESQGSSTQKLLCISEKEFEKLTN